MRALTGIFSEVAGRLRRVLAKDPLSAPLSRTPDLEIDRELVRRGLSRGNLFAESAAAPPHRRRLARMLASQGFCIRTVVVRDWDGLKEADGRCAACQNVRRCERWLRWGHRNDAPRMFCPNSATFDRFRSLTECEHASPDPASRR